MKEQILYCGKAPSWLIDAFNKHNLLLKEIGECPNVLDAVKSHIDLMAVKIDDKLFVTKETPELLDTSYEKVIVSEHLSSDYPKDVPLNVVCLKDILICNLDTASSEIVEYARSTKRKIINVKQGYTNCSVCTVTDTAIITDDMSIYKACKEDIDVLLVEKGSCMLPPFDYGFIGGSSACIDGTVYFFGDLELHPQHYEIKRFIEENGGTVISLMPGQRLLDIGGVIF